MSYNRPYILSTVQQIASPDISLLSSPTGFSYINQSSISDQSSISGQSSDRQFQERQRRIGTSGVGTAPTTLLSYTNGGVMDSTSSSDPFPRRNGSATSISSRVPSQISSPSSQQEMLNVAIEADMKLNEYLMIYENNSRQNVDARRFRNVMKDSSLIVRRSNVSV